MRVRKSAPNRFLRRVHRRTVFPPSDGRFTFDAPAGPLSRHDCARFVRDGRAGNYDRRGRNARTASSHGARAALLESGRHRADAAARSGLLACAAHDPHARSRSTSASRLRFPICSPRSRASAWGARARKAATASLFLDGGNSNYTKVLVDGVPANQLRAASSISPTSRSTTSTKLKWSTAPKARSTDRTRWME